LSNKSFADTDVLSGKSTATC